LYRHAHARVQVCWRRGCTRGGCWARGLRRRSLVGAGVGRPRRPRAVPARGQASCRPRGRRACRARASHWGARAAAGGTPAACSRHGQGGPALGLRRTASGPGGAGGRGGGRAGPGGTGAGAGPGGRLRARPRTRRAALQRMANRKPRPGALGGRPRKKGGGDPQAGGGTRQQVAPPAPHGSAPCGRSPRQARGLGRGRLRAAGGREGGKLDEEPRHSSPGLAARRRRARPRAPQGRPPARGGPWPAGRGRAAALSPRALSPRALSPRALSPRALSPRGSGCGAAGGRPRWRRARPPPARRS
jgi:hypothetical protein